MLPPAPWAKTSPTRLLSCGSGTLISEETVLPGRHSICGIGGEKPLLADSKEGGATPLDRIRKASCRLSFRPSSCCPSSCFPSFPSSPSYLRPSSWIPSSCLPSFRSPSCRPSYLGGQRQNSSSS